SISTLLIYHDEKTIERFIHGITTRIREKPGRKGFLIAVNAVDTEPILTKMAQFCDKVVKIE
ncbi:MAG: recombinase RecA, partial [Candidatus Diapherotrites archaeon]